MRAIRLALPTACPLYVLSDAVACPHTDAILFPTRAVCRRLFVVVGWLGIRIARLTMVVQKLMRERSRRSTAAHLDVAFPDVDEDEDEEDEEFDIEYGDVTRYTANTQRAP